MGTQECAHIRDLEDRRYRAMLAGDTEQLRLLLHPELAYTHSNAQRDGLDSYLEKVDDGRFTYLSIDHPIDAVHVENDCAVVIGSMRATVEMAGERRELDNAALAVWVRTDDGWKLLAYQPTPRARG